MGDGYIKWRKNLGSDPRILTEAHKLAADPSSGNTDPRVWRHVLLGVMSDLWTFADTYADSEDKLPITPDMLPDILKTSPLVVRHIPQDWLRTDEKDGSVYVPGYCARNGIWGHDERKEKKAVQRKKWAAEKRRYRAKVSSRMSGNGHAEDSDKTRSMSDSGQTPPTGTGTGTAIPVPYPYPVGASDAGLDGPAPPPKSDPEEARRKLRALSATLKANPKGSKP